MTDATLPPSDGPNEPIPHDSLYNDAGTSSKETIVLIHGAFSSRKEWNLVTPFFADSPYHLLVPDLPGHGAASQTSFSLDTCASTLAALIRSHATNGTAHVVGLSLGAHVAIAFVAKHPELVRTALVSGYQVFPALSGSLKSVTPVGMWLMTRLESLAPAPLVRYLMDGADMPQGGDKASLQLCREISEAITLAGEPPPWPARTLVVAAGKGGIVPSADSQEDARRLAEIGAKVNEKTYAVVYPRMRHPWNRQNPKAFAELVKIWIEDRSLPEELRRL